MNVKIPHWRIAKQEVVGGVTKKWLYLYDGWDIVGVTDSTGALKETFTRGVGLAGDIGTLVAVTHHAGSITNGTFYTHHNHRGDIVLVRSGTTTTATYSYSAFGTLTTQTGTDLSRFKFSSKEREASSGLSYYGYRFYAPQWQRWNSREPYGEVLGANLYRPFESDPLSKPDKDGRIIVPVLIGCAVAIIGVGVYVGCQALDNYCEGAGIGDYNRGIEMDKTADPNSGVPPSSASPAINRCISDHSDDLLDACKMPGTLPGGPPNPPVPLP